VYHPCTKREGYNMEFIPAKTIISGYTENNPWFGNNYSMNIYKGCCHGCIYCDSRSEDLLNSIKRHSPVLVKHTVTTADDSLCSKIEPNAPAASRRFEAVRDLSMNGIFTGILLMPVLPFLEDNEDNISNIIDLAYEKGAKFIYPAFGVTLRQNQREWFYSKIDEHFPSIRQKYVKQYGNSYKCASPRAKELWKFFRSRCDRLGILYKMSDIINEYQQNYLYEQISMF